MDTPEADQFRILLATDLHLGYALTNPIRGNLTLKIQIFTF